MQPVTKQTLSIWWKHTIRYKAAVAYLIFGSMGFAATEIIAPNFVRNIIDLLGSANAAKHELITKDIWYLFWLGIAGMIVWRPVGYVVNFLQPRVMSDLLNTCYEYLLGHSIGFFNNNFAGSIVTRVRRYQGSYERFSDVILWDMTQTALQLIFVLGFMFYFKPIIGLMFALWTLAYLTFAYSFARYKLKFDIDNAAQETKTTAQLADTISNSFNILLFSTQKIELSSFRKITDQLSKLRKKAWDIGNHANAVQGFSMVVLQLVVLLRLNDLAQHGQLTTGEFVQIQTYMAVIFARLWSIGHNIKSMYEALADANEMTEMLLQDHAIVDAPNAKAISVLDSEIKFRNVEFYYDAQSPILKSFSLDIRNGEKIAFVGPSGAGKSTIMKLLLRFEDVRNGNILIDGQDIALVTQESLRRSISFVPQEPILFHRSLLENIRYGKPEASDEDVIVAAKAAHAHEFISKFPDGYKTLVGERGVKLSGGERQRVAIARAILKDAPILVLDEATSSLDSESESLISDALHNLMKGRTTIAIAHRLSTVRDSDRIVVLVEGEITGQGTHYQLMKTNPMYRKLWEIQVGGYDTVAK